MNARVACLAIMICCASAVMALPANAEQDDAATRCDGGRCEYAGARAAQGTVAVQAETPAQAPVVSPALPAGSWPADPSLLEPCWGSMSYLLSC